jgi:Predicted AAA-ATPase/PD-(D/E)XK nuclease superfamily
MRLPLGMQDFASLRSQGFVYVDKTPYIFELLQGSKYQFLSRPRRFGKSLLISTLQAIFEGRRELFAGLWLESRWNFEAHPVIRLDFSQLDFEARSLEVSILEYLRRIAREVGLDLRNDTPKSAFEELILELSKQGSVVVLIDEYDKPITDYLLEPEKRDAHQAVLRGLYGVLKPLNAYLHQVFFTGVSKIGKLSLFSDLNQLEDISLDPRYAQLCGYTRAEIEAAFPDWVVRAQEQFKLEVEPFWDAVKFWFNGFSWDGAHRLYCPFSFLLFLSQPAFKSYWYETGTPTFLVDLIKTNQLNPLEFEHKAASQQEIGSLSLDTVNPTSLMFQTGYLTIESISSTLTGVRYVLEYPNNEVRQAFSQHLLQWYSTRNADYMNSLGYKVHDAIAAQDWTALFDNATQAYSSIPYLITPRQEAHYHSLFHMLLSTTGYPVYSELLTSFGRMDTMLDTRAAVLIFEFKMSGTAKEALDQIDLNLYDKPFRQPVYKFGVVFDDQTRNIKEWAVQAP